MINKLFLVVSLFTLCLFFYGILISISDVEENLCKMTYMYEYPQFVKINFKKNDNFPKYKLYAYSEGHLTEKARNMVFTGAPVLFIPGNSGSYKQVRSLASVALRKGIDNNWMQHLDYFTVDLNEEYSGIFGGVLAEQTLYLEQCVETVLKLYERQPNPPKKLVIVGHSMGGKIAHALTISPNTSSLINTIITIATPMDEPILSLDYYAHNFYNDINAHWLQNSERKNEITNQTNTCCAKHANQNEKLKQQSQVESKSNEKKFSLNDKMIVSIGGGSRDVMVHSGLTNSKFSDVHAMATNIPNVWLTTDHLCAVWCLQLVLVINRFIYSIIQPIKQKGHTSRGQAFIEDKATRLMKAQHHFENAAYSGTADLFDMIDESNEDIGDWIEDSRRVFSEKFKTGLSKTRVQMIRLLDTPQYTFLKVEVVNLETYDWVFGCAANEVNQNSRFCSKATSLTKYATKFPSLRHERTLLKINLHQIKAENPDWTHVLLRFSPTNEPVQYNVDIFNPSDRELTIPMPKWYSFFETKLMDDTMLGSTFYHLKVTGMDETYQTIALNLQIRSCSKEYYHTVAKVCVPWTEGFDRYHYFTKIKTSPMFVYSPKPKPNGYNSTENPINVELHLDPNCRYRISIRQPIGMSMARIVQQFAHWLPAHLVAIILLSFKHQISLTPKDENFKCGKLHAALCKCTPFFIITASRVFAKFMLWFKLFPAPESYDLSIMVSIIIHGSALAILTLATAAMWGAICLFGNFAHKILFKLINIPIPSISSALASCIQKFPMTAGVVLISISFVSCGGIALICGSAIYFFLISKMYEDYLEEFVFKTAKVIAMKLFGRYKSKNSDSDDADSAKESIDKQEESIPETSQNNQIERQPLTEEELAEEAELTKLMEESLKKQKEFEKEKNKEIMLQRVEYDAVHDGLSNINFHMSLLFLLIFMALLNLPSTITWAKNYSYATTLKPDPSLIPALVVIICASIIWQMPTPRNIIGYKFMSKAVYVGAVACVLYCQESIYRLNFVICAVYVGVTLHQLICPKMKPKVKEEEPKSESFNLDKLKQLLDETRQEELGQQ